MSEINANSYIITHSNGKTEAIDAMTASDALSAMTISENESKVKQVLMMRESIIVKTPDIPDPVSMSASVQDGGLLPGNANLVAPSTVNAHVGDSVEVVAVTDPRFVFAGWRKGSAIISTAPSFTYSFQSGETTVALEGVFILADVPLSVQANPANGGTVFCSVDKAKANSSLRIMATPATGYSFDHWERDGAQVSTEQIATITVAPSETTAVYTAVFTVNP